MAQLPDAVVHAADTVGPLTEPGPQLREVLIHLGQPVPQTGDAVLEAPRPFGRLCQLLGEVLHIGSLGGRRLARALAGRRHGHRAHRRDGVELEQVAREVTEGAEGAGREDRVVLVVDDEHDGRELPERHVAPDGPEPLGRRSAVGQLAEHVG